MKRLLMALMLSCSGLAYSYTISHTDYTSGGSISASGQNANENAIVNVINGNLDSTNIAASGVATSNIAANAVTTSKIAVGAVTGGTGGSIAAQTIGSYNIANSTISNTQMVSGTIRGSTANSGGSGQEISQGTISTPDLRTNAVSLSSSSVGGSSSSSDATVYDTLTITTIGKPVLILATVRASIPTSGGNSNIQCNVTDGGTSINGAFGIQTINSSSAETLQCHILHMYTPSAGSHTFKLSYGSSTGTPTSVQGDFVVIELRS